ncbi:MAG: hypothetical protein IKO00_05775 [Oscillospiraceae bacterium]|nr:hypothetical protein [Oscillospiraceae bacterium]
MDHVEREILYESQRVDIEFAVTRSLAKSMAEKGKTDIAERLKEAAEYLQRATFALQAAHKWLGVSVGEQLMMEFFDGD